MEVIFYGSTEDVVSQQVVIVEAVFEKMHPVVRCGGDIEYAADVMLSSDALTGLYSRYDQRTMGHLEMIDAVEWYLLAEVFAPFLTSECIHLGHGVFCRQIASFYPGH